MISRYNKNYNQHYLMGIQPLTYKKESSKNTSSYIPFLLYFIFMKRDKLTLKLSSGDSSFYYCT